MISIYPVSILLLEINVLNLKQANCGTTYRRKLKQIKNFGTFKKEFINFFLFEDGSD